LVVRLRQVRQPTVLRRQPQGLGILADAVHRPGNQKSILLHLQANDNGAAMRRLA
jgi:hypothetical protein